MFNYFHLKTKHYLSEVEEVHCNQPSPSEWLVPPVNGAMLGAQHWPLRLAGSVLL